jgi:hypothetical protein
LLVAVAGASNALLSGPAGVGETRLLTEFASHLATYPQRVDERQRGGRVHPPGSLAPVRSFWQRRAPRAIVTEFYRRSRESPIVLIVDDAHAPDGASAALVHQLCRTGGVPVVTAVRTGETAREPDRRHLARRPRRGRGPQSARPCSQRRIDQRDDGGPGARTARSGVRSVSWTSAVRGADHARHGVARRRPLRRGC